MDSKDYYSRLADECGGVLAESFDSGRDKRITSAHSLIADLEIWHECLAPRLELPALIVAAREYQYAMLAMLMGQYRQSFGSLRTYMELTLGALHFSATELEMRLWLRGERDISWTKLSDENNGVLSHTFARAFFPELAAEVPSYRALAVKVYRECSVFVHANPSTHEVVPGNVKFDEPLFESWLAKAETTSLVSTFALVLRYFSSFAPEQRSKLEAPVLEQLSHVGVVRNLF